MAKLTDKFFNRVIEGKLVLSDSERQELIGPIQSQISEIVQELSETPTIWYLDDSINNLMEHYDSFVENFKLGDFLVDENEILYVLYKVVDGEKYHFITVINDLTFSYQWFDYDEEEGWYYDHLEREMLNIKPIYMHNKSSLRFLSSRDSQWDMTKSVQVTQLLEAVTSTGTYIYDVTNNCHAHVVRAVQNGSTGITISYFNSQGTLSTANINIAGGVNITAWNY